LSGAFPVVLKIQDFTSWRPSRRLSHRAFRLVHFAFGLELGVSRQTANGILHCAFGFVGRALNVFLVQGHSPNVEVLKQRLSLIDGYVDRVRGL
jgi:hypothetical protein